jgi:hypothetical protein
MDREIALAELRRLARILWDVHHKRAASQDDAKNVYDILLGWHAIARHHVTTRDMIDAIYAVTSDLDFSLNTVRTLFPEIAPENSRTDLQ